MRMRSHDRTMIVGVQLNGIKAHILSAMLSGLARHLTNLGQRSCESEVMEIGGLALGIQVLGTVLVLHDTSRLHWIERTRVPPCVFSDLKAVKRK